MGKFASVLLILRVPRYSGLCFLRTTDFIPLHLTRAKRKIKRDEKDNNEDKEIKYTERFAISCTQGLQCKSFSFTGVLQKAGAAVRRGALKFAQ